MSEAIQWGPRGGSRMKAFSLLWRNVGGLLKKFTHALSMAQVYSWAIEAAKSWVRAFA